MRFHRGVRVLGASLYILQMVRKPTSQATCGAQTNKSGHLWCPYQYVRPHVVPKPTSQATCGAQTNKSSHLCCPNQQIRPPVVPKPTSQATCRGAQTKKSDDPCSVAYWELWHNVEFNELRRLKVQLSWLILYAIITVCL